MPPINSLPVEILAHIFTLSTHTRYSDDVSVPASFPFDPANILTALSISGVNRLWNKIALSTSLMWTDICVSTELPRGDDEKSHLLKNAMKPNSIRLEEYLKRSKNSPIDIFINLREVRENVGRSEPLSDLMNSVFDLIIPHTCRWRSITILTDTHPAIQTALNRLGPEYSSPNGSTDKIESAQLLERIVLKRCNNKFVASTRMRTFWSREPPFAALLHSGFFPRLKELGLHGVFVNWRSLSTILSLGNCKSNGGLRILEISAPHKMHPSILDLWNILKSCSRLQRFVFNIPFANQDTYGSDIHHVNEVSPVVLIHLQELSLGFFQERYARCIMKIFAAPNLTSLRIANMGVWPFGDKCSNLLALCGAPPPTANRQQLIGWNPSRASSKFPSLRELTLHGVDTDDTTWYTLFGGLPTLQHLILDCCNFLSATEDETHFPGEDPLTALLPVGDYRAGTSLSSVPCPDLQSLTIRFPGEKESEVYRMLRELCVERSKYGIPYFQYHVKPVGSSNKNLSRPRSDPLYINCLGKTRTRDPTVEIMGGVDIWVMS